MTVSTHVLDAATGRPAPAVPVRLARADGTVVAERDTDADGRVPDLAGDLPAGVYRLCFDTAAYAGADTFYPEVVIAFRITDGAAHHHVPLLLSPFAYSTYRGS
jgi:5-hydroxyisourate hydrolase